MIVDIYQDSREKGICRACGAPIEWAEVRGGGRVPFEAIVVIHTQPSLCLLYTSPSPRDS